MSFLRTALLMAAVGWCAVTANAETLREPAPPRLVLIFVYDAGETLGLLPVASLLAQRNIRVRWAPLTPWAAQILAHEFADMIPLPEGLNQMPHVKDRGTSGDATYWMRLAEDQKPDLVITGMVSGIQEELAKELKTAGVRTVGFYDSFDTTERDSIMWRIASRVDRVWVPTKKIKDDLNELGIKSVKALGQPTLEIWSRIASSTKPDTVFARLGIPANKAIIVFAGQYGDGYNEILAAFVKAAQAELDQREDLYLVLSPHPKTNGDAECAVLAQYNEPRMMVMPVGISTADLAIVSRAVVTWRSTVGTQAAFLGKPVIYFNFAVADYRNDLIEHGLAQAATPETFGAALRKAFATRSVDRRRLLALGYVVNSDQKIADEVRRLIK
ncbi:MAG: hypothetical protein ABIP75_12565 [Pyrinomonadaceae bacterium]